MRGSDHADTYPPIEELGALGNGHSVAPISRTGTIEWWCPERFDRPPVFAAILDRTHGGRFDCRVEGAQRIEQSNLGDSNVLSMTYQTPTGTAELADLMPLADDADELRPHHGLMRRGRCTRGEVSLRLSCAPRFSVRERRPA